MRQSAAAAKQEEDMPATGTETKPGESLCLECGHSAGTTRTVKGFRVFDCACPGMTATEATQVARGADSREKATARVPKAKDG